jgi:uncharacterized membrane-anchored protein YjiN (DUF445 family)
MGIARRRVIFLVVRVEMVFRCGIQNERDLTSTSLARSGSGADDVERARRLARAKNFAGGLLVFCGLVFVIALYLEARWEWVEPIRVTAEAALIGGLADWFAVTALFRHPLGIPIPHTAIIRKRKARIGQSLGRFIQSHFLTPERIALQVAETRPGERLARWLAEPVNAQRVAGGIGSAVAEAVNVLDDQQVSATFASGLEAGARSLKAAPLLARLLTSFRSDRRYDQVMDETLRLALHGLARNESLIRDRVQEESPWWVPQAVGDRIHDRIMDALERTLADAAVEDDHPIRVRLDDALQRLIERLETSPETIARAEAVKDGVLSAEALESFTTYVWADWKAHLRQGGGVDSAALERTLTGIAQGVLADAELLAKLDRAICDSIAYALEPYREEVARLVERTIDEWEPEAASQRIELQVGRDLQFIRINGTVVGGLVGLALYGVMRLFG